MKKILFSFMFGLSILAFGGTVQAEPTIDPGTGDWCDWEWDWVCAGTVCYPVQRCN